jgi:chromosomal replication initiation ATPase DnaA
MTNASIKHAEHDRIIDACCALWDVTPEAMKSSTRVASVSHPRQVAMYLIQKRCQAKLNRIGMIFGNRDHTTVHHGIKTIAAMQKVDPDLANRIALIERDLDAARAPFVGTYPKVTNANSGVSGVPASPAGAEHP